MLEIKTYIKICYKILSKHQQTHLVHNFCVSEPFSHYKFHPPKYFSCLTTNKISIEANIMFRFWQKLKSCFGFKGGGVNVFRKKMIPSTIFPHADSCMGDNFEGSMDLGIKQDMELSSV